MTQMLGSVRARKIGVLKVGSVTLVVNKITFKVTWDFGQNGVAKRMSIGDSNVNG